MVLGDGENPAMSPTSDQFAPEPAAGDGSDIFSGPELFYLSHRHLIDDWAALAPRASAQCHQWLREHVAPAIERWAEEHGWTYDYVADGDFQICAIAPPGGPRSESRPVAAIALAWDERAIGQSAAGPNCEPYVGLSIDMRADTGTGVREAVMAAGAREARGSHLFDRHRAWPAYRHVQLHERWWGDLDGTRTQLVDETAAVADLFGPFLPRGET